MDSFICSSQAAPTRSAIHSDVARRRYELAIQLPGPVTEEHVIRTDDPVGIERYWHSWFAERRRNGEWFELTRADVSAFKRRKFM